jgi:hypothetical protein
MRSLSGVPRPGVCVAVVVGPLGWAIVKNVILDQCRDGLELCCRPRGDAGDQ